MHSALRIIAGVVLALASWYAMPGAAAPEPVPLRAGDAARPVLPAQLPLRREGEDGAAGAFVWRAAGLLLLAGGAGGWLLWRRGVIARASGGSATYREPQAVVRLSSQALTPQASVHSVRWNGEEFLLGCTPQQVTLLARSSNRVQDEVRA